MKLMESFVTVYNFDRSMQFLKQLTCILSRVFFLLFLFFFYSDTSIFIINDFSKNVKNNCLIYLFFFSKNKNIFVYDNIYMFTFF